MNFFYPEPLKEGCQSDNPSYPNILEYISYKEGHSPM